MAYVSRETWPERALRRISRRSYTFQRESHATRRSRAITYLSPLFAIVTGVVHAGLAPVIVIGGVKPNLVLVAVVLVTCLYGFLPGITWAFAAGLTANLLVGEPLGSVPLAMLIVAALVAGGGRLFGGLVWVYPILAAFAGSVLADVLGLALFSIVAEPVRAGVPLQLILPAATLNAAIAALLLYPARALTQRFVPEESGAW
ncbi:MAG: rod shape-determining protein MreD [Candidatus Limnocylindria bacterium]